MAANLSGYLLYDDARELFYVVTYNKADNWSYIYRFESNEVFAIDALNEGKIQTT